MAATTKKATGEATLLVTQTRSAIGTKPKHRGTLRGRRDLAVAHDEYVLARTLGDVALVIEQDRLFVAGLDRLDLGQDAVEVLP